jgi:PAS domain S-box-containing protein
VPPPPSSPDRPTLPEQGQDTRGPAPPLEAVLTASLDGIVVLEPVRAAGEEIVDFTVVFANPRVGIFIPPPEGGFLGVRLLETYPGNRESGLFDAYRRVAETGEPFEHTVHYTHEGLDMWLMIMAVQIPGAVAVTFRDVTAVKLQEEALRESEERFRLLAENARDIVTQHGPDGTSLYVSPAIERVLGYRPAELVGRDNRHLIHPDDAREMQEAEAARTLDEPFEGTVQYRARHRDGHYVWLELSGRMMVDEAGHPTGIVTTTRDITDRKEAEQALEARNRELQEFAYAASHDLQEPLRKIRAYADVLVQDFADVLPEEARSHVGRMQAAAARMSSFIRDLLALSRVSTRGGVFVPVDPARLLADVLSDLEIILRETDANVEAGPLPTLEADPMQLRQLFQNLVGNAVKFHRAGVRPEVRVRGRIERSNAGEQVVFEVEDNGIGFEERFLDRIFTPFQRLHARERYEGSGVGLAICRRIAERHGGTLSARSVPGRGSTFVAIFPRVPPERAAAMLPAPAP